MIGMHMANELLTPAVAAAFILVAAIGLGLASWRTRKAFDPAKVPLMGVMGAFVFAAQMINFPILPGTSGHLGGGVLLAILLGPHAASLVMAAILIIQCLIFQDGGLLALGANVLNLGLVPCYLGYGIYRVLVGRGRLRLTKISAGRLYLSVFMATFVGMLAGAALVPVQVAVSGVLTIPLRTFLGWMLGVHALIALVEAAITFAAVAALHQIRPDAVAEPRLPPDVRPRVGWPVVAVSCLAVALVLGGVVSHLASGSPDGLEKGLEALGVLAGREEVEPAVETASAITEAVAPDALADYGSTPMMLTIAGIVGTLVTLGVVWCIGLAVRRRMPAAKGARDEPV